MDQEQRQRLINRLALRFWKILRRYPVDPLELFGSIMCAGYGVVLLLPMRTFAAGKSFEEISRWMSELCAGSLFFVVGVVWMAGLLYEHRPTRIGAAFIAAVMFGYWAGMIGSANFASGGWWTYGLIALVSVIAVGRNAGRS